MCGVAVCAVVGIGIAATQAMPQAKVSKPKPDVDWSRVSGNNRAKFSDLLNKLKKLVSAALTAAIAAGKSFNIRHKHHIIAKNAWQATPAWLIYCCACGNSINNPNNIALVKDYIHQYLHLHNYQFIDWWSMVV